MALYDKINADLKDAMKAQDKPKLECLRMMKSKIMAVDARGAMPDAEIEKILRNYAKSIKETVEILSKNGKAAEAKISETEAAIVESYLPKQLDEAATKALVDAVIAEVGATAKSDIGKVMKAVLAKGQAVDGKLVNQYAASKLA